MNRKKYRILEVIVWGDVLSARQIMKRCQSWNPISTRMALNEMVADGLISTIALDCQRWEIENKGRRAFTEYRDAKVSV